MGQTHQHDPTVIVTISMHFSSDSDVLEQWRCRLQERQRVLLEESLRLSGLEQRSGNEPSIEVDTEVGRSSKQYILYI